MYRYVYIYIYMIIIIVGVINTVRDSNHINAND